MKYKFMFDIKNEKVFEYLSKQKNYRIVFINQNHGMKCGLMETV